MGRGCCHRGAAGETLTGPGWTRRWAPRGEGPVLKVGWLQKTAPRGDTQQHRPPKCPEEPAVESGTGDIVKVVVDIGAEK